MMLKSQPRLAEMGGMYMVSRSFSIPHGDVFLHFSYLSDSEPFATMECNYAYETQIALSLGTVACLAGSCDGSVFLQNVHALREDRKAEPRSALNHADIWINKTPRTNYVDHIATNYRQASIIYYELGNDYFELHPNKDIDDDTGVALLNTKMVFPMIEALVAVDAMIPDESYFKDARIVQTALQSARLD